MPGSSGDVNTVNLTVFVKISVFMEYPIKPIYIYIRLLYIIILYEHIILYIYIYIYIYI